jgi:hypothetical protein
VEQKSKTIIDVQQAKGSVHDFSLYKATIEKTLMNQ